MKKQFSSLALAALMSTSSVAWAQTDTPTVVLVHGAFADGSSWSKVIPLLREKGLDVVSVQNPLSSLEADVDATRRAIDQVDGPVVLVGHSWAGVVITEAGNNPKVNSLVYVAAFVPDAGQSIASMTADLPPAPYAPYLRKDDGGYLTLSEEGVRQNFAPDLSASEAEIVAITQGPWNAACIDAKVTNAAWREKPTRMVIAQEDRMIPPALQEQMALGANATVVRVPSSHVVMLSHPEAVAEAIVASATELN
ncbi:MAG: hypothetical protein COB97_07485 [Paracoccus sp.]|nr:MAG: hypothetical protein COB97_07485 [Paracoccus sp. (in: a-proteobacteria)]